MAKKINLDEIDESLIIAAVKKDKSSVPDNPERLLTPATVEQLETAVEETSQPTAFSEQSKEENRTKRVRQQEYESLFIHESDLPPARFGKSVYIRKDYHDKISQIISVIGVNEVSLFGYIDNVLTHHFENFGEDITQSFKKKIIFK
jgi:hypothetical protein